MLAQEEIIGIFDLDTATQSALTRDCLSRAQKRGEIREALDPGDLPRSFVITPEAVYLSSATPNLIKYRTAAPGARKQ